MPKSASKAVNEDGMQKELAVLNAPRAALKTLPVTSSATNVTFLLDVVNKYFPDMLVSQGKSLEFSAFLGIISACFQYPKAPEI